MTGLRRIVRSSRWETLDALGSGLPGTLDKRRLSEILTGHRLPERHELHGLVRACAPTKVAAFERLLLDAEAEAARPSPSTLSEAVGHSVRSYSCRVNEFHDWRALGVHQPVARLLSAGESNGEVEGGSLPEYVPRDRDIGELRPALRRVQIHKSSALVVVAGESAAGKTRLMVEAVRAELGEWRLILPHGSRHLDEIARSAELSYTVVWLDELHQYLVDLDGVEAARRILSQEGPVVLLGSLRPDAEAALHPAAFEFVDRRAQRVDLSRKFTESELAAARESSDPRVRDALANMKDRYGLAEWMAAGPQIVRHLRRAESSNPLGATTVKVAVDLYRAGVHHAAGSELLLAAVNSELAHRGDQITTRSAMDGVLRWAIEPVAGASAPLLRTPSNGYQPFDYLLSEADSGTGPLRLDLWRTVLDHHSVMTLFSVARAAEEAGQSEVARECLRRHTAMAFGGGGSITRSHSYMAAELLTKLGSIVTVADWLAAHEAVFSSVRAQSTSTSVDPECSTTDETWRGFESSSGSPRRTFHSFLTMLRGGRASEVIDLAQREVRALQALIFNFVALGMKEMICRLVDDGIPLSRTGLLAVNSDVSALRTMFAGGDDFAGLLLAQHAFFVGDAVTLAGLRNVGDSYGARLHHQVLVAQGDTATLDALARDGDLDAESYLATLLALRGDVGRLAALADDVGGDAVSLTAALLFFRQERTVLERRTASGDKISEDALVALHLHSGARNPLRKLAKRGSFSAVVAMKLLQQQGTRGQSVPSREEFVRFFVEGKVVPPTPEEGPVGA